jgi:hypothetical protein
MGVSEKGEQRLAVSDKGKVRASLSVSSGAGHLAVLNAKDLVVANVTGKGTADGGAVTVGNGSGKGVANLKASTEGGGFWQLTDPSGNPVVEAGAESDGRGLVRAGPYYQCSPAMGTALVGVAMLPDCIL